MIEFFGALSLLCGIFLGATSNHTVPASEFEFEKCEVSNYIVNFNKVVRVECKDGASYDIK